MLSRPVLLCICTFLLLCCFFSSTALAQDVPHDSLSYIVVMKSGDSFRGNVVGSTDSTLSIQTEFGIVVVRKALIQEFISVTGPYKRPPQHFFMPTASPNGPGGFISNYELGFLYAGFGLGYGATITGGMTLVPTFSAKSQLYHVGAKFTVERSQELEVALGASYSFVTTSEPYTHIYGVATFPLGTGRYSAMLLYRVTGSEIARVNLEGPGDDTTGFTIFYEGSLGAAFGLDAPAFGRDDMMFVGEIWNNDISKPQNTASMFGIRVMNEHLSGDFGVALFTAPLIIPVTRFTWRF